MAPLKVFTIVPQRHTASFYYRLHIPLLTAQEMGLPIEPVIDIDAASHSQEQRISNFCEADVVLLYQPVGEGMINNLKALQAFIPTKRDGKWKWPPTVIMETDDNLFNVSPLNPAFKNLGVRDMNGELIPLGNQIGIMQDGVKKVLYVDGENGFSLARNRQTLSGWRNLLGMADAVTCSTPDVAEAVKAEVPVRRLQVFPNLVRFDHYEQVNLVQDDKIRIMWQGGSAHYEDWYPLREALGNVAKKYDNVEWIIWGAIWPWVKEFIPSHRLTFKNWAPYQEYKLRLAMMNHDISLAPLADHVFNRSRSAIKWYEASVLKKPAATLAQNTGAYAREIQDGQTGLLFKDPEEFEAKLCLLIEDQKKRKELAANAKDWISENRDAMKEVPAIVRFWQETREERKFEQPPPSEEQYAEMEAEAAAEREQMVETA